MLQKLKKSKASSNFWNNVSTVISVIVYATLMAYVSDPELIKNGSIFAALHLGLSNASNIITHLNKD